MTTDITNQAAPRIFLHAGIGLEFYTNNRNHVFASQEMAKALEEKLNTNLVKTKNVILAFPEGLVPEKRVVISVMEQFFAVSGDLETTFSVVTFNTKIFESLLNSLIDTGFGQQMAICLHLEPDSESYTTFLLDSEGFMIEWPYGILESYLRDDDLRKIGFTKSKFGGPT